LFNIPLLLLFHTGLGPQKDNHWG